MGLLAESRSRSRISEDPNNTKWTRDTTTFGQRMLRAQGWEPGQFLGVKDSAHAHLHTAASASHIRVSVKDGVEGLGWSRSKEDEVTGLDVFSDLLSRLNGKSDEAVAGEQQARLVVKTNRYVEKKYGPMRFVRGGFLVGDVMEEVEAAEGAKEPSEPPRRERKGKKRKASEAGDEGEAETEAKAEKRRRREEKRAKRAAAESKPADGADDGMRSGDDAKGARKPWDNDRALPDADDDGPGGKTRKSKSKSKTEEDSGPEEPKKSKREGKGKGDKGGKGKRRDKKDNKDKTKTGKTEKTRRSKREAEAQESSEQDDVTTSASPTGASTPSGSGTGTSTPRGPRNFVRSRFIAAKRQAMLDTKALNQIFMIKT